MPSFHVPWSRPLLAFYNGHVSALLSYIPLPSPQIIFSIVPGRADSIYWARGENNLSSTSAPFSLVVYSFSSKFLPDEAGPGVAAGVAKVDDQGKVAVVDGDLRETNDTGDALLL